MNFVTEKLFKNIFIIDKKNFLSFDIYCFQQSPIETLLIGNYSFKQLFPKIIK